MDILENREVISSVNLVSHSSVDEDLSLMGWSSSVKKRDPFGKLAIKSRLIHIFGSISNQ